MDESTTLLGQIVKLTIDRLANGGDGVGRYDGKVIFVPFSAPGDELEVEVVSDRSHFARGRIVKILQPSPERVEAPCKVFGRCGGCQWQHLDYKAQLRHKQEIFRETLCRVGGLADPRVEDIVGAQNPWEYRQRIQIKVNDAGEAGFYESGTHEVVPVRHCHIADPHLNQVLSDDREWKQNVELVWDEEGNRVLIHREDQGSFAQVNPAQNQRLLASVLEYIQPQGPESVVELYCGNGNFSLPLAPQVKSLFAVDVNPIAVGRASRAARKQGLKNVEFVVGQAEWGLKKIKARDVVTDVLLLDPPRRGAKGLLDLIALVSPRRIIYVSCDPASLARDLKFLSKHGYRVARSRPIDMFPQTHHIESVTELVQP